MFQDLGVGLALAVGGKGRGVRGEGFAGAEVGKVALDVAGGAGAAGGGEADVGGHDYEVGVMRGFVVVPGFRRKDEQTCVVSEVQETFLRLNNG